MESQLSLLDRVVRSAESLREGEHGCLGHRKRASDLCLLYKIRHRVPFPLCLSICIISLQLIILEVQLLWVN